MPSPDQFARAFAALVDTLIPGDDRFPAASAAGAHGLVMDRLRIGIGHDGMREMVASLGGASLGGAAFVDAEPDVREQRLIAYAEAEPERFMLLRMTCYYAYYQLPAVTGALRAQGHDYNDAPQPAGYAMAPFHPTPGVHLPETPRGSYKATDEIVPLEIGSLSSLDLPISDLNRKH